MYKLIILLLSILPIQAWSGSATNAVAAEASLHKIERLISSGTLNSQFATHIKDVTVELVDHENPEDPAFRVTVNQIAGPNGLSHAVSVNVSGEGRALNHRVVQGTDAENVPSWGQTMAVTFMENALHLLLDHGMHDPKLTPFFNSMTSLELKPEMRNGVNGASADINSSESGKVLRVHLDDKAKYVDYELL